MESILELFGELWAVWTEMFGLMLEFAQKMIIFTLWVLCGIIILPCVFVSGTLFPKWSEWGEKM